jgi:hypothetical protein
MFPFVRFGAQRTSSEYLPLGSGFLRFGFPPLAQFVAWRCHSARPVRLQSSPRNTPRNQVTIAELFQCRRCLLSIMTLRERYTTPPAMRGDDLRDSVGCGI